ncbi:hypothetical protein [Anaeromicrobium sediminis]|uniref:Small, acid-soluble spore protein, alpha/beta type n=1 Tax=Anaeromicrobium sediminis TaxID=1478221 RepID=A0A267MIB5_9FIRM|nr:hypothetical protein [Anaeromicrobium sediminis]PAB59187.1 hypothetical protein CCE28_11755 [Anaeromicrobium sediminis]
MNEKNVDFKELVNNKSKLGKEIGLNNNEVARKVEGKGENVATLIAGKKVDAQGANIFFNGQ